MMEKNHDSIDNLFFIREREKPIWRKVFASDMISILSGRALCVIFGTISYFFIVEKIQ